MTPFSLLYYSHLEHLMGYTKVNKWRGKISFNVDWVACCCCRNFCFGFVLFGLNAQFNISFRKLWPVSNRHLSVSTTNHHVFCFDWNLLFVDAFLPSIKIQNEKMWAISFSKEKKTQKGSCVMVFGAFVLNSVHFWRLINQILSFALKICRIT